MVLTAIISVFATQQYDKTHPSDVYDIDSELVQYIKRDTTTALGFIIKVKPPIDKIVMGLMYSSEKGLELENTGGVVFQGTMSR